MKTKRALKRENAQLRDQIAKLEKKLLDSIMLGASLADMLALVLDEDAGALIASVAASLQEKGLIGAE